MDSNPAQLVNQAVFRILERVHGQTDLNALFSAIQQIILDLMEKCKDSVREGGLIPRETLLRFDHDLRTPMCGIVGFAELLAEELEDPAQKTNAEQVLQSARKVMEILNHITKEFDIGLQSDNLDITEEETPDLPYPAEMIPAFENIKKPPKSKGRKLPDVLIVEDNMMNIQLLMIYIRKYCNIFSVRNAKAAVDLAGRQKFDAILMDIHLGAGMNGIEAMHQIRKIPGNENIPIIAVTAYASYGDRGRFLREGFTDYVQKPIDRGMIREVMERLFKKE
ncbi:MAG: response regulator [Bacteroidales bacterium]|nr:response regulator [Bacteroidales bacterium]